MILAILLLLSGLAISGVAIYYSVVGLTAIFAAAAIPIMIMGVSLEVGKLVIASWVKAYWDRIPFLMKSYAVIGVTILMVITSLGIFGFLSKAHSDQTLVSGDGQARIAVYDEKIKISRDNIEANRRALKQMDEAVDQSMARSNDEKGADKAVAIRRSQQRERGRLQSEIQAEQTTINRINEEAAPIRAENRKIEAEVGPIKYIAAFVYGDNPDAGILERAVTWVIILIVIVFDPLAIVMLLAAQMTFQWYKDDKNRIEEDEPLVWAHDVDPEAKTVDDLVDDDTAAMSIVPPEETPGVALRAFTVAEQAALDQQVDVVHPPEPDPLVQELALELETAIRDRDDLAEFIRNTQSELDTTVHAKTELELKLFALERDIQLLLARITELETPPVPQAPIIEYAFLDKESEPEPVHEPEVQVITPTEELTIGISETATRFKAETVPVPATAPRQKSFIAPPAESEPAPVLEPVITKPEEYITDPIVKMLNRKPNAGFGTDFPDNPTRGDMFLRTDFRPTRLFKWNDTKWIEVNKATTDAYSYNDAYIQYLADKLFSGEYQLDDLTEVEQQQVQTLLGGTRG
jgi:hypothetical protein